MREVKVVPSLGGGLNLSGNPLYLDDAEWLWSNGFWPNRGTAEVMRGWTQLVSTSWLPSSHRVVGIVADLLHEDAGYILAVTRHVLTTTDTAVTLIDHLGNASLLSVAGTDPDVTTLAHGASGMAVVSGLGYIALGDAATSSLLVYTPNATASSGTFNRVNPSGGMEARFCAGSGGRVWLGYAGTTAVSDFARARQVRYSDANDGATWVAAISNSADTVTVDSPTQVSGLTPMAGGVLVTTYDTAFIFRATGSIPAYTVEQLDGAGSDWQPVSTPAGPVLTGHDGARTLGGERLSDRLGGLLIVDGDAGPRASRQPLWHPRLHAIVYPRTTDTDETFVYLDPTTGRGWRAVLPAGVGLPEHQSGEHALTRFVDQWIHAFAASDGAIYTESQTHTNAYSGAFVCSKLFTFGAPPMAVRIHRVKVDVEPLSNATTDAITVSICAMDHLSSGILGSVNLDMDGLSYTSVGTLTGGASELPVDAHGKYIGFKFTQSSGKVRIRGFSFEWSPAGDRIP